MRIGAHRKSGIIGLALAISVLLFVLITGCDVAQPYKQAEGHDESLAASQEVPSYRLPQPPVAAAPPPAATVSETSTPPVFLEKLQEKASKGTVFKYCLDERYKRYHRFSCPYAPKQTRGYELDVQGTDLAHREVMQTTGTHMSRAQIKAKGYKPCQHCRPDLDEPPAWYRGESRDYRQRQAVPFNVHGSGSTTPDTRAGARPGQIGGSTPTGLTQ